MTPDEARAEVARLKAARTRRTWNRSKLERYGTKLHKLREAGASYRDLALWLTRQRPPVKADPSTIRRFMLSQDDHEGGTADASL